MVFFFTLRFSTGNVGSQEEEESTVYYDDSSVTPTPDYDYNATFDYYYGNSGAR